jgi:hypothetical protein
MTYECGLLFHTSLLGSCEERQPAITGRCSNLYCPECLGGERIYQLTCD